MKGTQVLKKIITDSRFWAALWTFAQVPLVHFFGADEFGRQMIVAANMLIAALMAIVFGVSKSASTMKEVASNELRWRSFSEKHSKFADSVDKKDEE